MSKDIVWARNVVPGDLLQMPLTGHIAMVISIRCKNLYDVEITWFQFNDMIFERRIITMYYTDSNFFFVISRHV